MPIKRRRKLTAARKAKRSFRRVNQGQDGRSERPARWHEQRPDASETAQEITEVSPIPMYYPAVTGGIP
jgi:hypothetical protein